jgi:hypothetical protein
MKTIQHNVNGIAIYESIEEDQDYASPELVTKRIKICNLCEFLDNDKCSKCSCLVQHRTKYIDIHCPEGKW